MASHSRVRTALLAAVLAVGLTACAGAGDDAAAPGPVAGEGPARPGAGGPDLVVEEQPLETPVILDPIPDGLSLTQLWYSPPDGGYEPLRATLYGDPDLADTLDGPVLLVGTSSGSATIAGPPSGVAGQREVDLGGRTGRVVPDTDRIWVVFEGNEYTDFVVGRGIGEHELVAAARGADFESATTSIAPEAVPAGLEALVAGSPQDGPGGTSGEHLFLQGEEHWASVSAVRADPRLAALWGFWVEDAAGTAVRGHPGSAGGLQGSNGPGSNDGGADARARVWAEDGLVLAVTVVAVGLGNVPPEEDRDRLLDEVVGNLRVGTWADFDAWEADALNRPPTPAQSPCPSDSGFVSGVEGAARWVFHLAPNPSSSWGEWSVCRFELTSGGGGGGSILPSPPGELAVHGWGSGVVGGVAPPGTERVSVTAYDGSTRDAVLAADGPRPGERVWGSYIPLFPPPGGTAPFTVTAHDAAGAVLDSRTG